MKQPELGRKIADLRKAKGLTQEELVDSCNLNIRTLQRIESGEVTPRNYTLKVIFSELDYDYFAREQNKLIKPANLGRLLLHKILTLLSDVFNLKKNVMKKTTILTTTLLIVFISFSLLSYVNEKQETKKVYQLIEKQNKNSTNWFNEGKIDLLLNDYASNACFYRNNQPPCFGKREIYDIIHYASLNRLFKMEEIEIISLNVADSIAIEKSLTTSKTKDGQTIKTINFQEWHKIKGRWLIVNDIDVLINL